MLLRTGGTNAPSTQATHVINPTLNHPRALGICKHAQQRWRAGRAPGKFPVTAQRVVLCRD